MNTPYGFALVVTSTTRPTTPPDLQLGRVIVESDTGRILWYDGTGWIILDEPAQTTTAALFTGFTTGTPTYSTTYHRNGGYCDVVSILTFGSTPGSITAIIWAAPIAGALTLDQLKVALLDTSAGNWYTGKHNAGLLYASLLSGNYQIAGGITLTAPFTWAIGDGIYVTGRYQMNSKYS